VSYVARRVAHYYVIATIAVRCTSVLQMTGGHVVIKDVARGVPHLLQLKELQQVAKRSCMILGIWIRLQSARA
jgi:hypothetical protein